jgi:hypothetical protein
MLRETLKRILPLARDYDFKVDLIAGDFLQLSRFVHILDTGKNPNCVMLLGGQVGNFEENNLLECLNRGVTSQHILILDSEFLGSLFEIDLAKSYKNEAGMEFVFFPLEDLGYRRPEAKRFEYDFSDGLDVKSSRTIQGFVTLDDGKDRKRIKLFSSTKLDKREFHKYLTSKGFKIIKSYAASDYQPYHSLYVLMRDGHTTY